MLLAILASLIVAYALWSWICLELNVRRAARMQIPCVRLPIDSHNILWMLFEVHVWRLLDALPIPWHSYPTSIRCLRRGWHFREKAISHTRLGPMWALVSPVSINLLIADPEAIGEIFARRRDFIRPIANYKILEVFGPCISTADVNNWPRHRKALAAPFNETIMSFVWDESIRQTKAMLESWKRQGNSGIPSVQSDTRSLSLNVLAATGFKKSYEFIGSADRQAVEVGSYRQALQTVLDNAIPLMLIPYKLLMFPLMPKSWARIGNAGDSFKRYMVQMLDEESQAMKHGTQGSGGIMTSLVHALHAYQPENGVKEKSSDSKLAKGLSVDEIFGNIFVINFAGHDTTANTLAFSMLLLARNPAVQEWVNEEVREVMGKSTLAAGTYETYFPRFLRCKAILYETLRLYPPIMALPKGTDDRPHTVNVQGRQVTIPPNTGTTLSVLACQTNPTVWKDPLVWQPSRWIVASASGPKFFTPPPNTYFPFSDGPQNCPGKKFAEVEFIAALALILGTSHIGIELLQNESPAAALDRVQATVDDVNMEMLLRMKDADRVKLICGARS